MLSATSLVGKTLVLSKNTVLRQNKTFGDFCTNNLMARTRITNKFFRTTCDKE